MLIAYVKGFERKLDDLLRRWTENLRSLVRRRRGRPVKFTKNLRERYTRELQVLTAGILRRQGAQAEFRNVLSGVQRRNLISNEEAKHPESIVSWARRTRGPVIYSFWRGPKKCLYVGKAEQLASRLANYVQAWSRYFSPGITLKVHGVKSRSRLVKAECLAMHLYDPQRNGVKASHQKWAKACPICKTIDQVKNDLSSLLRIK